MNTFARKPISKSLLQACTAAVLMVTCLNAQALDSNVEDTSNILRVETMNSLQAELKNDSQFTPNLDFFNAAVEHAKQSENYRSETLHSLAAENNKSEFAAPSLNLLTAALESNNIVANNGNLQATRRVSVESNVWNNETTLLPSIANLGSIEYEAKDAATREATMLALNFAIVALENARSTLAVNQRLAL